METYLLKGIAAHLDYLHLGCGLAWFLFGCMCRVGIRWKNPLAAGWLQLAVLAMAVAQWSRVLNEYIGINPVHDLANFCLTLIPSFLLLEYAYESVTGSGRVSFGRAIVYGFLLVLAGWFKTPLHMEQNLWVHSLLIVPGALASAGILHRSNWRHSAEGRWLGLTAFCLVTFMGSTALTDSWDRMLALGWSGEPTDEWSSAVRPLLVL